MFKHALPLLLSILLSSASSAQCLPVTPPGGWAVATNVGTHIYTDGYLVEMVVRAPAVAPPVCGGRLVVGVLGGGGSKAAGAGLATSLASNG